MLYAVVNTKGGVGKTTTAIHLATLLARQELGKDQAVSHEMEALLAEVKP